MLRTHTCGALRIEAEGQNVTLAGWVQTTRDFGKFNFIDLRDRFGITQIAVEQDTAPALYEISKKLGREFVIQVSGKVRKRSNPNPQNPTGEIEIEPTEILILNASEVPPFKIENETDGLEELRMQYRYLDIRRPVMAQSLVMRARTVKAVRQYLDGNGFLEIETPFLIKSTPEGARDFLVPSRLQHGSFYALPQSPQILKQLLMVAGMDRYYQIVKCFRDEDFRGDRQPEFTQIDCEMSFVEQEDILQMFEGLTQHVYQEILQVSLPSFARLSYAEAFEKYGTDKPDCRFGMEIQDFSTLISTQLSVQDAPFVVFQQVLSDGGNILALHAKGAAGWTRKELDQLTDFVKAPHRGGTGLIWARFAEDGTVKSSVDKFFHEADLRAWGLAVQAEPGDMIFLLAGDAYKTRKIAGDLRLELGTRLNLRKAGDWSVLWVLDFPMFETDPETGELIFVHHPFVSPHPEDIGYLDTEPAKARALCYDMVINGNEIVSGSVRIHRKDVQDKIFGILGLSEEEKAEKFGFLLNAFRYGAPPHAGCAFGLDRWVMLMAGGETIRDVIAFPKNSSGRDLMMDAPATVPGAALKEVGIQVTPKAQDPA
jgi:aspartyl-tRNA synthetase